MMPNKRRAMGHQRHIDGEFVAAGDELLGTVERIDQEEAALVRRFRQINALLGQCRDRWNEPRKSIGDDAVGGEVRFRHRRSVDLAIDPHGSAVDGKNGRSGPGDEFGQGFHERGGGIAFDHGARQTCLTHWRVSYISLSVPVGFRAGRPRSGLPCVGSTRLRSVSSQASMRNSPDPRCHRFLGTPYVWCPASRSRPRCPRARGVALFRVCHDLISPVGAIVNGLEVLDDNPKPEDREFALDLIRKSAKTASARLQFCRLAFGAAGSAGAQIDLGDAQAMARGHLEDSKTTIAWNLPRVLLPKNRVKLLLNMMVIAQQTIPRGGVLTVDPIGEGDGFGFRVTANGLNARMPQNIADLLSSGHVSIVDAHAVQPYYTRLLAQSCGLSVTLAPEGNAVVVAAS